MKILIVSGYFEPINTPRSFRTTELAKELGRQGHQVKVIVFSKLLSDVDYSGFEKEHNVEVQIVNLKCSIFQSKSLIARSINRILSLLIAFPAMKYLVKCQ